MNIYNEQSLTVAELRSMLDDYIIQALLNSKAAGDIYSIDQRAILEIGVPLNRYKTNMATLASLARDTVSEGNYYGAVFYHDIEKLFASNLLVLEFRMDLAKILKNVAGLLQQRRY